MPVGATGLHRDLTNRLDTYQRLLSHKEPQAIDSPTLQKAFMQHLCTPCEKVMLSNYFQLENWYYDVIISVNRLWTIEIYTVSSGGTCN